jgi:hypothetical protein
MSASTGMWHSPGSSEAGPGPPEGPGHSEGPGRGGDVEANHKGMVEVLVGGEVYPTLGQRPSTRRRP